MRQERPGSSSEQAAKGSLISTYEAETELFWMWAGPTCFLSSGEGCRGLRPCVESGPEHEDSSPVLTWILEYFWSLPKGVLSTYDGDLRDRLWCPQERPDPMCSRLTTGTSGTGSGALRKGQTPWLSHVHTWWESILGFNVKVVQGKQVPLEWTDTSGGLSEWWHDPEVPPDFPVESASS
ncbi:hypothetical protein MJT46_008899 [Ovis ammon polii x Ovis aries]|nr:hypothetical protein MJT46_008899 [Ovis ammon polii x Ovis aries]